MAGKSGGGLLRGPLGVFVYAAIAIIVIGLFFGVFNKIATEMNSNNETLIPQEFTNLIPTASSYAALGILILILVGLIGLVMYLARSTGAL